MFRNHEKIKLQNKKNLLFFVENERIYEIGSFHN